jgi:hypothetical protein
MFGWADAFDWEAWWTWFQNKVPDLFPIVAGVRGIQGIWHGVGGFFESLPEKILAGMRMFVAWLVDMAVSLFGWLPDHVPLVLPPPDSLGKLMRPVGMFSRFIDLPFVFGIFGLLMVYTLAVLLYSAYRAVLGLVPMLK